MLADDFDLADFEEDDDCGCLVTTAVLDGVTTEVHHWIPDDFAPHDPTPECGCGPNLRAHSPGRLLFEHVDQDASPAAGPHLAH